MFLGWVLEAGLIMFLLLFLGWIFGPKEEPVVCDQSCKRPTSSQAHCSMCHRTYSRASVFDLHRRNGECLDPTSIGLVERDQVWRRPLSERGAARLADIRQERERDRP